MNVRMVIEIDDDTRKCLRRFYGQHGLATRKDVRSAIDVLVAEFFHDLRNDYEKGQGQ